jgi:hypothetical protein
MAQRPGFPIKLDKTSPEKRVVSAKPAVVASAKPLPATSAIGTTQLATFCATDISTIHARCLATNYNPYFSAECRSIKPAYCFANEVT